MHHKAKFYLLRALYFGRIMRVVGIDCKGEYERATLVHPL